MLLIFFLLMMCLLVYLTHSGLNLTLAPKTPSVSSLRGVSLSAGSQSALKTPAPVRDAFSRMSLQWDDGSFTKLFSLCPFFFLPFFLFCFVLFSCFFVSV